MIPFPIAAGRSPDSVMNTIPKRLLKRLVAIIRVGVSPCDLCGSMCLCGDIALKNHSPRSHGEHGVHTEKLARILIAIASILLGAQFASAQSKCLSPDDVKKLSAQIDSPQTVSLNKKLRGELLKMMDKAEGLISN